MVVTQNLRNNESGDVRGTGDEEAIVGDESLMELEAVVMAADDAPDIKAIGGGVASHGNEQRRVCATGKGKRELTK